MLDDLGFIEITSEQLMPMLNDVWKYERLTDFDMDTSFEYLSDEGDEEFIQLHCKYDAGEDVYNVYASGKYNGYFSAFITRDPSKNIADINNTEKIITALRLGVTISIPSEYVGMYLKTTAKNQSILIG